MDEALLTFDCLPSSTPDMKLASTTSIITTRHENIHMTVVLACCTDGSMLKSMITFKRKTERKFC